MTAPAFKFSSGPKTAKIAIVGEAWGDQEEKFGMPFIGSAGQELTRMLSEAGIQRNECFLTNVLALRPPNNKIVELTAKKAEVGKDYAYAPLEQGKYLRPEFLPELERLREELNEVNPNVVIALGNTACWALLGTTRISALRGVVSVSTLCPTLKILPTYHPAGILRNWEWRTIALADLMKAKRESAFQEIRRPVRLVTIDPDYDDIVAWIEQNVKDGPIAVDIETMMRQIDCIGFATSRDRAICISFADPRYENGSFFKSTAAEVSVWRLVQQLLESPNPKIFQHGLFDLQYIYQMGFRPKNCFEDTMLLHHAMYPELQKGLGFLGSLYTNEAAWKLMRHNKEELKRDE